MITEIRMPQLGQTSDEIKLVNWLVGEGEKIEKGQALCEIETDKATMEMESYAAGRVLKLIASPESIIKTGQAIALIGDPEDTINDEDIKDIGKNKKAILEKEIKTTIKEDADNTVETTAKKNTESTNGNKIKATKLVKNIARIKKIDLSKIKGTGPRGIITKNDLEEYDKSSSPKDIIELTKNQLAVAKNLLKSKTEVPHYYLKREIVADKLIKFKESAINTGSLKISIYSILIYVTVKALKEIPKLNGYFKDNKIILRRDINIGFALSVGDELYVPVIRNANNKSMLEIDEELKILVEKAKKNDLEVKDISGGTFTITNLGMFGVDEFSPIINVLQLGILSIGKIRKIPFIDEDGNIEAKNVFSLTGSFDHRAINGKLGAEFIDVFSRYIEKEIY